MSMPNGGGATNELDHVANGHRWPVRIAIGRFDTLTYRGLAAVFSEDESIHVVAEGLEASELKSLIAQNTLHVVILDETTGRDQLDQLKGIAPAMGVLVLAHKPLRAYRTAVLATGAGCLARGVTAADLLAAVHLVAQGEP